jgi:hypothetical protein
VTPSRAIDELLKQSRPAVLNHGGHRFQLRPDKFSLLTADHERDVARADEMAKEVEENIEGRGDSFHDRSS